MQLVTIKWKELKIENVHDKVDCTLDVMIAQWKGNESNHISAITHTHTNDDIYSATS